MKNNFALLDQNTALFLTEFICPPKTRRSFYHCIIRDFFLVLSKKSSCFWSKKNHACCIFRNLHYLLLRSFHSLCIQRAVIRNVKFRRRLSLFQNFSSKNRDFGDSKLAKKLFSQFFPVEFHIDFLAPRPS